jgi:hypothetical protein
MVQGLKFGMTLDWHVTNVLCTSCFKVWQQVDLTTGNKHCYESVLGDERALTEHRVNESGLRILLGFIS